MINARAAAENNVGCTVYEKGIIAAKVDHPIDAKAAVYGIIAIARRDTVVAAPSRNCVIAATAVDASADSDPLIVSEPAPPLMIAMGRP
ncbi:MAG: hypothetical protein ABJJ06_14135 [Tateyamaria sp.]